MTKSKTENIKSERIFVRLFPNEKAELEAKAKAENLTISEYVRSRALDYDLTYKLTEEEIIVYKQLNSFSDHFRRISNLFKLGDITQVKEVSVETAELIRKHLEKLKK